MEYCQFYKGDKMGVKDAYGRIVIPALYEFVSIDSDDLFLVKQGKKHAYFNAKGKEVIPFEERYESYGDFTEGLARVRVNDRWGYINKAAQEVILPQFIFAEDFSGGLAIVRNDAGLHGVIDKTGKLVIDYRFKTLLPFKAGYAKFGDHVTWGLIDKQGNVVVPQEYTFVEHIIHKKVRVQIKEGEDYKEGLLTIGHAVKWNNNLDKQNAYRRRCKDFRERCEVLVKEFYLEGCPCEYERFRNYIQWNKPIQFIDQDVLYHAFAPYLKKVDEHQSQCKTCGSLYTMQWEQYSISLDVIKVRLDRLGTVANKGAKLSDYVPVSLGFRGHGADQLHKKYLLEENEVVINYLKETPQSNQPWTKKRSWWKILWNR